MPGRSKTFNELFKQYRDEKTTASGAAHEPQNHISNQNETHFSIVNEQILHTTPTFSANSNGNNSESHLLENTNCKKTYRQNWTQKTPPVTQSKKDLTETHTVGSTPLLTSIINETSSYNDPVPKAGTNHLPKTNNNNNNNNIGDDQSIKAFNLRNSNDFINAKYDSYSSGSTNNNYMFANTQSQHNQISELMANGDVDYRSFLPQTFQVVANSTNSPTISMSNNGYDDINSHHQLQNTFSPNNAHNQTSQSASNTYDDMQNYNRYVFFIKKIHVKIFLALNI